MNRKHFIALANTLRQRRLDIDRNYANSYPNHTIALRELSGDIAAVAQVCEQFNPRFDRDKFIEACNA